MPSSVRDDGAIPVESLLMTTRFAVTWDYRCPFARNAHEHIVAGLDGGADWDVTFTPFSLGQSQKTEETRWQAPDEDTGLLALQVGTLVRDKYPESFYKVHLALFAARHDEGLAIRERDVLAKVLTDHGLDADEIFTYVNTGAALDTVRSEHDASVEAHHVWGVPTFIIGDRAVFVRLMDRPEGDTALATTTIDRVLGLLDWPELNEFKHTTVPR